MRGHIPFSIFRFAMTFTFHSRSESDTARLGAALADALPGGSVVALVGTLGAGKTRLVQAVAEASGVAPATVVSPTFVLVHEYQGRRPVFHFDAYRLKDDDEFLELGPDEYFERGGVTLIEWADRVERCLPQHRLTVQIHLEGPESRRFEISSTGGLYDAVLERLADWEKDE